MKGRKESTEEKESENQENINEPGKKKIVDWFQQVTHKSVLKFRSVNCV